MESTANQQTLISRRCLVGIAAAIALFASACGGGSQALPTVSATGQSPDTSLSPGASSTPAVQVDAPAACPTRRVAVIGETGLLAAEDAQDFQGSTTRGRVRYAAAADDGEFVFHISRAG